MRKETDVFPSVSRSVPVSAVVRLAAVEEGVLGVMHPVCFSQSAPTQSPPQYVTITHHTVSH